MRTAALFWFVLVLAYVGLLYFMPFPWNAAGMLAPFALLFASFILRAWRIHYDFEREKLHAKPVSAWVDKPRVGGRESYQVRTDPVRSQRMVV